MKEKSRYLTISEFSKISDMSRKALILKELGMPSNKIKTYVQNCTPADTDIRLVHQEEKPIFSSDPFSKKKRDIFDEEWIGFYLKCRQSGIAFGYPEGFMVCKDRLPKGNYITACGHGSFQDTDPIYAHLLHYIHKNQLKIAGNAYEILLIDEVASKNAQIQLIQVYIQIK